MLLLNLPLSRQTGMNLLLFAQNFIASIDLDVSARFSQVTDGTMDDLPRNSGGIGTKTFDMVDLCPYKSSTTP